MVGSSALRRCFLSWQILEIIWMASLDQVWSCQMTSVDWDESHAKCPAQLCMNSGRDVKRFLGNSILTSVLWCLGTWLWYFYTMHTGSLRFTLPSGLRWLWWKQIGLPEELIKSPVWGCCYMTGSGRSPSPCSCKDLHEDATRGVFSETMTKRREIIFPVMVNCYDINERGWDLMWLLTFLLERDLVCSVRCWYRKAQH